MIRYGATLTRADLLSRIAAHDSNWLDRAKARTDAILAAGAFTEESSIWGAIKLVYMRLQHFKCIYCERPLAGETAGSAEQDVEHFRPKKNVKTWPRRGRTYPFPTGSASPGGYYWLAYDPENYAAACKPCNGTLKSDNFPVLAARGAQGATVGELTKSEKPLLIYPLGQHDTDPETLIAFEGIVAVPAHKSGIEYQRARVTIDFFQLNEREELWEDRFRAIRTIFQSMSIVHNATDATQRAAAQRALDDSISESAPQALCARSFLALMRRDAQSAWQTYLAAEEFVRAKRGGSVPA